MAAGPGHGECFGLGWVQLCVLAPCATLLLLLQLQLGRGNKWGGKISQGSPKLVKQICCASLNTPRTDSAPGNKRFVILLPVPCQVLRGLAGLCHVGNFGLHAYPKGVTSQLWGEIPRMVMLPQSSWHPATLKLQVQSTRPPAICWIITREGVS